MLELTAVEIKKNEYIRCCKTIRNLISMGPTKLLAHQWQKMMIRQMMMKSTTNITVHMKTWGN